MSFATILTTYGLGRIAAAAVSGVPINLTHLAVGDGSGAATTPGEGQVALVNERWRTTINTLIVDPALPTRYIVEAIIPAHIGGWVIREFGIFDDNGSLFAVGSFPATYKPVPLDGAVNDLVIRVEVLVANAGVITLVIDPAVAVATRAWVLSNVTPASLFPGGTTGQVLTKASNADGDANWQTPGSASILVDVIEEPEQAIAAGQLTVNLAATTTLGLAVFVEGVRIPRQAGADGWQQGTSNTQIVLGKQYPVGHRVHAVQNLPAGSIGNPLQRSLNLSDVQSAATARANLGVLSAAESSQLQPAGNVSFTARATPPTGWLAANGALVSRTTYAALFAAIGTTYGAGDGSTTFALPDLRGEFIRGLDSGRGVDTGRTLGSAQGSMVGSHTHTVPGDQTGGFNLPARSILVGDRFPSSNYTLVNASGGSETRPRNVALLAIIKF